MTFDLPTVQALVAHYARVQGLGKRAFEVQIVPGLQFYGADAWATVKDRGPDHPVLVSVRDLVATPPTDFKGDLWTELKVTISHELWHLWVNALLADPSIENEEAFVEAAAQAVVHSAGADARVMARSIQAIPSAVRARAVKISARTTRARGGTPMAMNADTVKKLIDAIEAKDAAAMTEIGKQLLVEAASGDAPTAPSDTAAPPAGGATDMRPAMPPPAAKPGEAAAPDSEDARMKLRKARQVMSDEDKVLRARQVAAVDEAEASAGILRTTTIRARIHEAREVDKVTISAEAEKLILAAPSIADAEIRLILARGSAVTTTQRARAVDKDGAPVVVDTVTGDAPNLDGLSAGDLELYNRLSTSSPSAAKQYAVEAQRVRARLVASQGGAS